MSDASPPDHSSEPGAVESVCERIVFTVADREGVDPLEIQDPLYEAINPDALETLFRESPGRVTFPYMGYLVTVTHEQEVTITDQNTE